MSGNFVVETSFEVDYAPTHITKWKSKRTGLQLTYINQASPVVNGFFAVATECVDDSGCPHTLEHLVFMGSKKYPYKGLLDTLGNGQFSSTNAWTAVDQTVYTLTTAGWEGFKTLLPIYLDHLLNPTLTDEACLTEVYHIDGDGKEKGVVFSEMQGIESQSWFISLLNLQRSMYPKSSGYSSETGGLLSELRKLTNEQIREFHKLMYRPDNLCVILTGTVEENELLEVMNAFDNELEPLNNEVKHSRPFVDSAPIPKIQAPIINEIEFPDDDESMGEIYIGWIGPKYADVIACSAVDQVGSYFTDSAISKFTKNFVEVEDPLATDVDYTTDDYLNFGFSFTFSGVPSDKLRELDSKVKELIKESTLPENIDMKYMHQVILQQKLKLISYVENSATNFSNNAISEFLYGDPKNPNTLADWVKTVKEYDVLMTWNAEQWSAFIQKWFVENNPVSILSKPSPSLQKSLKKEKKEVSRSIKEKYGKDGLQKLAEVLKRAEDLNDTPIPDELLLQFEKPDPSKINFIKTESFKAGRNSEEGYDSEKLTSAGEKFYQALENDGSSSSPLFFHFENYKSQFTTVNLIMSSEYVSPELLKYFAVLEELFSLPIQDGKDSPIIPHEEVIQRLNEDFIDYSLYHGYQGNDELVNIKIKFESTKYEKAIEWLRKVIFNSIFDEKRVKIIVEKTINSNPDKKRNEELVMYSAQDRTVFTDKSIKKAQNFIQTESFYKELLEKIEDGQFESIANDLEKLRTQLFALDNLKVFVVGNCQGLANPISSWNKLIANTDKSSEPKPSTSISSLIHSYELKSEIGQKASKYAHLVTTPATDTTHLVASTKIPSDYLNPDINKIALVTEILCAVEGPFWRGIRGTGLAYGANIRRDLETGFLNFTIYRGADGQKSWTVARDIVNEFAEGKKEFDSISVGNAISSLVNVIANSESNSFDAANNKINDNIFKKRGPNYASKFLDALNKITPEELVHITKKYFQPLFDSKKSILFSCLPGSKVDSFKSFLEGEGFEVTLETISAERSEEDNDNSDSEEEDDDDDEEETDSEEESGSDDSDDEGETESEED